MGFFDAFKKKKEDFGFSDSPGLGEPPIDSHSTIDSPIGTKDMFTSPSSHSPNMNNPNQLNQGMSMPIGENISQKNMNEAQSPFPPGNQNPLKQDFEILSSKLDYLKAGIEAVNQRLANLEHLVRQEQDKRKW